MALVLAVLLLAMAGCGGDDEPSTSTARELPDLALPTTTTPATPPVEEKTAPTTTAIDPATETLPEEGPPATTPQDPADTPENDAPPPQGSPAERFEQYCNENPGACG